MNIAYLITAYDNPAHFARLVRALARPTASIYVHVDAKSSLEPFESAARGAVTFVKPRVAVYWGEYTMVEAILQLLRSALRAAVRHDYFVLISGTDYPIRSPAQLDGFLAAHAGTQFMNLVAMPNEDVGKPLSRLQRYNVPSGRLTRPLKFTHRTLVKSGLLPARRCFATVLRDRQPYGGSTWWTLTRAACLYLLQTVERETELVRFYRNTVVPDEGLFHTIIGNSHFAARVRRNLTYTQWLPGASHPQPIDAQHVRRFIEETALCADDRYGPGELFFARKFSDRAADLIAMLDDHIAGPQTLHAAL